MVRNVSKASCDFDGFFLYFADSRGHSSGLQSREAREIVSYDDL